MTIAGYVPASTENDPTKLARSIRNIYENAPSLSDIAQATTPGGRLTLSTGAPVMSSTVAATGTLLYTPDKHARIPLYTSNGWVFRSFSETSLALSGGTASKPHDIFGYDNNGTLALELLAWTNDTTRATALARQDGFRIKNGDATRLWLGTVYLDGSKQSQWTYGGIGAGGVAGSFQVWNAYNRRRFATMVRDNTDSWTLASAAIRQANNSASMKVSFIQGDAEDSFLGRYMCSGTTTAAPSAGNITCGVGYDVTNAFSGSVGSNLVSGAGSMGYGEYATSDNGWHSMNAIESAQGAGTQTFYGDAGVNYVQPGLFFEGFF